MVLTAASTVFTTPADAAFYAREANNGDVARTDALERNLDIVPGTATQPGTSIQAASGSGLSITVNLGRIPDSRTILDVIRLRNNDASARTINLGLQPGLSAIDGLEYDDGSVSKSLTPGTVYQLRVRTYAARAGAFTGFFALSDADAPTFLRRDRPIAIDQAPLAPGGLTIAKGTPPAIQFNLSWTASASTGVAGYNVYRATAAAGPFTKVNASTVSGTTYADTTINAGTRYYYKVRAIATGVAPELESPDSNVVNDRYSVGPTAVRIPAGASNPLDTVNIATSATVATEVVVPAGAQAGDVVTVVFSRGATTVTRTATLAAGGAQTVSIAGTNLTGMTDGAVALSATLTSGADISAPVTGTANKDTVAPAAPTAVAIAGGAANPANYVNIATRTTVALQLAAPANAGGTTELRLTSGAANVTGSVAAGTTSATLDASALADTATGALAVSARSVDPAWNASAWFVGTAATKDTVMPAAPNFSLIDFTNRPNQQNDRIQARNGAVGALDQMRVWDYGDGSYYPATAAGWDQANTQGSFGNETIAQAGVPRVLGYELRDAAWNTNARVCRRYTANGTGADVACP